MTIYAIYGEAEPVFAYTDEEPRPAARRPEKSTLIQQVGRDTTYLLPTLFLAIIAFVVVFTLVTVGVSLAIMWFGLPIMVAGLVTARGFAHRGGCDPTVVMTDMSEFYWGRPEIGGPFLDMMPLRRWPTQADVAGPVVFLLSDQAGMITGAHLPIDGGYSSR